MTRTTLFRLYGRIVRRTVTGLATAAFLVVSPAPAILITQVIPEVVASQQAEERVEAKAEALLKAQLRTAQQQNQLLVKLIQQTAAAAERAGR